MRHRSPFKLIVLLLALAWPRAAKSDPEPMVAPRLIYDPGAAYPASALAEHHYASAEVVVILEVDTTGAVASVQVENPVGHGFDEAAEQAARQLRFEPALRDGQPIAAKIKFRYTFTAPAPSLSGRVADAVTGVPLAGAHVFLTVAEGDVTEIVCDADGKFALPEAPRGAAHLRVQAEGHAAQDTDVIFVPGDETRVSFRLDPIAVMQSSEEPPPIEVTVRGEKLPPAVSSYTRAEVRQIPGAFGDPFRAIETLPGVTPVGSGLPFFYVRGAPPGNVGYFLEDIRVPYLFHIGFGPSVIAPSLVNRVDLYPGGYPARWGRYAGGVVTSEATLPRDELHGEANLRLFDVGAVVESRFAKGRGSVMVGGRYSYTAAILSLAVPEIQLDYRDYQARVSYDISPRDRVTLFNFGSYDLLAHTTNGISEILLGTEFYRSDLRYDHRFDRGSFRTGVTLGYDRTSVSLIGGERRNLADRSINARAQLSYNLHDRIQLRAGTDVALDRYRVSPSRYGDLDNPDVQSFNRQYTPRTDLAAGIWLDSVIDITPRIQVTPGIRVDLYQALTGQDQKRVFGIDPRLAMRFAVSDQLRVISTFGIAHQTPSFAAPVPGLTPSLQGGLQLAYQTGAGVELDLDSDRVMSAGATAFYNTFSNMNDALGVMQDGPPRFDERSKGTAYGLEVNLKRRLTQRLGGFLTYTLSRSTRTVGGLTFPSVSDRTHVANAALSYDLGGGYRLGGRFVYYTGSPKQAPSQPTGSSAPSAATIASQTKRGPAFFRLDLRFEKRWFFTGSRYISFVAEALNATASKETVGEDKIGPIIIPSIGVEGGF